jgi:hypothetical protein
VINLDKERSLIESTALKNGFKLKQQHNGEMALNPYVFDFAEELLANKQDEITELKQRLEKLESGEFVLVPKEPSTKLLEALDKGQFFNDESDSDYDALKGYKAMIEAVEKDHE